MKFNEFKPQLTEEQIVLAYCKGKITKEDAVSRLREAPQDSRADTLTKQNIAKGKSTSQGGTGDMIDRMGTGFRRMFSKIPGGIVDSPEKQARQDAEATVATQKRIAASDARRQARFRNRPGLSVGPNAANAATPPTQYADDPSAGDSGNNTPAPTQYADDPSAGDSGNNTPAPTPAPTQRPRVAATAANTRDYDKTVALQKKLIAQGANIKADGLMGPNTRAAMKAANMGAGGQKIRTDMPGGPRISNAKKPMMKPKPKKKPGMSPGAMGGVAKPKPKPKPRTLGKQNSKMPKSFGGFGPRVDDPKGGETVNLPFGLSYKTLPKDDDLSDKN
jgi:hypothetical protein